MGVLAGRVVDEHGAGRLTDVDSDSSLTERVRTAHGDAWQAEGRLREPYGGGAAELPGVRLMASGIPHPQWNNGDVTDPALVDLAAVSDWYAERGMPWGVRVPAGTAWPHGRLLFRKRCMGLRAADYRAVPPPVGVRLVAAGPDDLATYAATDAGAFGDPVELTTRWVAPHLAGAEGFVAALAYLGDEPVGVATAVRTSSTGAGDCVGVFGVGVLEHARRRGLGAALTSYVVSWGIETGADLTWLNPDTDDAARLYARMGFVETGGFDIYVDVAASATNR